ncbi:hypothetical protein DFH06DRAFT_1329180 [Mycena polygramma]|nr:hypothetical protein DFH06DRAFT_1329180 [Mycena polygramma]
MTYRRPASGVKSFGKGRRQACCVSDCNQPLRALRASTPSTQWCFKLTGALPLIPFMILPNNLFPLAPHSIFNIQRSTGSKFEISPSREPGLRVQLYVAAPDSLAAANQPSNSPQSGLRLSTGTRVIHIHELPFYHLRRRHSPPIFSVSPTSSESAAALPHFDKKFMGLR